MGSSKRHHYIPEFLTKGFTNPTGEVYIYDKFQDRILTKSRPPKSIFFEMDRNSIIVEDFKSTIIEDEDYRRIDNQAASTINFFRTVDVKYGEIPPIKRYSLQMFLLNLFWRTPSADPIIDEFYKANFEKIPEGLHTSGWKGKITRSGIFLQTLKTILNSNMAIHKHRIIEFEPPVFVLSDFPSVYENHPKYLKDLDQFTFAFPISSRRMIIQMLKSEHGQERTQMEFKHAIVYNVLSINQSTRYTVSGDLKLLNKSVDLYRKIKEQDELSIAQDFLFNKIKF